MKTWHIQLIFFAVGFVLILAGHDFWALLFIVLGLFAELKDHKL